MRPHWFKHYVADTRFLQRYPFYASVLAQFDFQPSQRVPVMGVRWRGGRFALLVNEEYFASRMQYCPGVLLHEVHHLVLGHLTRSCFRDIARPDLMLLAMEVSANEYIAELLPDPIVWQQFRAQAVEPHQTTMHRYQLLLADADHIGRRLVEACGDHGGGDRGDGSNDGLGILDLLRGASPSGAEAVLHVLLRRARQSAAAQVPQPPQFGKRDLGPLRRGPPTAARGGLLVRDVDAVIEEFAPAAGPERVDWRSALRAFASRGPRPDWQRPNRRQPHRLFELPGRSWNRSEPQLLVAIDTSGSMGTRELAAVARELAPLSRMAVLTIVECDDSVRRVYPFAGSLGEVCGRGNTDLRPPFAEDLVRQHGRDGVVYFTDGAGPWPGEAPPVPVLWVLVGSLPFHCPFGQRAQLLLDAVSDADLIEMPF